MEPFGFGRHLLLGLHVQTRRAVTSQGVFFLFPLFPAGRSRGTKAVVLGQSLPMQEPEELLKPAVPAIERATAYDSSEEGVKRLGDSPTRSLKHLSSDENLVRKASRQGMVEEIETEEELELVRRKSAQLRESCSHEIIKEGNMKPLLSDAVIEEASIAIVRAAKGQGWDNEIAARLKKRMEKRFESPSGGRWHCIAGPDFGSYVSHEKGHMIYLYLPRYLAPTEKIEYDRDIRKKAEADGPQPNSPRLPPMPQGEEGRSTLDLTRTGPLLGEGDMAQRMIGILLWRT